MMRKMARLCWNDKDWREPSGRAPQVEGTKYVQDHGFGHEEWLFQERWILGGRRYGQITTGSPKQGPTGDVHLTLFTRLPVDGPAQWAVVAEVKGRFLGPEEAIGPWNAYREKRWVDQMADDVRRAGGNPTTLLDPKVPAHHQINFAYRPHDLTYFPPCERDPVADKERIPRRQYYKLYDHPKPTRSGPKRSDTRRQGIDMKPVDPLKRSAVGQTQVGRRHNEIQNALKRLLEKRYGKGAVLLERNWVDITVATRDSPRVLIEVKAVRDAWRGLREGLGQLLSYAADEATTGQELVALAIVTEGVPGARAIRLLDWIRGNLGLPIHLGTWTDDPASLDWHGVDPLPTY